MKSTVGHNVALIGLDGLQGILTDGDVLLHEHILPDGVHGEVLGLVHEHEAGGEVPLHLGLVGEVHGLQQGGQHGLGGGAEADGPAGHAVDGGIEEVQTDENLFGGVVADDFLGDFLQFICIVAVLVVQHFKIVLLFLAVEDIVLVLVAFSACPRILVRSLKESCLCAVLVCGNFLFDIQWDFNFDFIP